MRLGRRGGTSSTQDQKPDRQHKLSQPRSLSLTLAVFHRFSPTLRLLGNCSIRKAQIETPNRGGPLVQDPEKILRNSSRPFSHAINWAETKG